MTKLQTELTPQHGTRLLTMTPTADTITVVRHCAVIQCTKLHHRSQLGTLALSQLINLTKNMKLFTNVSVANKTATKTYTSSYINTQQALFTAKIQETKDKSNTQKCIRLSKHMPSFNQPFSLATEPSTIIHLVKAMPRVKCSYSPTDF